MRAAITIVLVAALCLLGTTYVAADGFAACVFQGSDTVSGYFTFQQEASGSDITVVANFTSHEKYSHLYLHFHTYGDLDLAIDKNECWSAVTLGPYSAPKKPHYILETSWVSGLNLFGSNSIVGRKASLYPKISTCGVDGLDKSPVAECVVGVRNVAAVATNTAGQYLESNPTSGYAKMVGTTGSFGDNEGVTGRVWFVPTSSGDIYVKAHLEGLAANTVHAIHVHAWGDITSANGLSAGLHLNPYEQIHGVPPNPIRHMGDMGNITTNGDGVAYFENTYDIMTLIGTAGNLIGRAVILHTLCDDGNPTGSTTSTGSAGGRVAKGIIGISSRLPEGYTESSAIAARELIASLSTPINTVEAPEEPPALAYAPPVEAMQPPAEAPSVPADAAPLPAADAVEDAADDVVADAAMTITDVTTPTINRKAKSAPAYVLDAKI